MPSSRLQTQNILSGVFFFFLDFICSIIYLIMQLFIYLFLPYSACLGSFYFTDLFLINLASDFFSWFCFMGYLRVYISTCVCASVFFVFILFSLFCSILVCLFSKDRRNEGVDEERWRRGNYWSEYIAWKEILKKKQPYETDKICFLRNPEQTEAPFQEQ